MLRLVGPRRVWSAYLLGMLTVALAALAWQGLAARPAYAQVPDSGAQRLEMVSELKLSNQRLGEIAGLLREIRDQGVPGKVARPPTPPPPRP